MSPLAALPGMLSGLRVARFARDRRIVLVLGRHRRPLGACSLFSGTLRARIRLAISRRPLERCQRTVTTVTPRVLAIAGIVAPSSSYITRTARRLGVKRVERVPDQRPRDQGRLRIGRSQRPGGRAARIQPGAIRGLPPSIAADVDQHANQPRFFVRRSRRHRAGRTRRPQKGLLDQVAGIVSVAGQSAGETIEPPLMGVEQAARDGRRHQRA